MFAKIFPWSLLGRRLGLIVGCYFLLRLMFLVANREVYAQETWFDVALAHFEALRFDLWAVAWGHLPLVLSGFAPLAWQRQKAWQKLTLFYVLAVNFWCFGLNVIDLELFKFTGKRLTPDWLKLQEDMQNQTSTLIFYYWWVALLGLILLGGLAWLWPRWQEAKSPQSPSYRNQATVGVAVVVLTFLALRGGWQLKPLSLAHAYEHGSGALGVLRMNSTFTFFRSHDDFAFLAERFFKGHEDERLIWLNKVQGEKSPLEGKFKGHNVIVLLVESLAAEYVGALNYGKGFTPFLDRLAKEGVLFQHNFANGRRSIEAVPSLVCGFPSLMGQALILSPYQGIDLHCLPELMRAKGYRSHFFHGAYNGSMHFDSFAKRAGFDHYYGFNEFNDSSQSDGHWGIFDEPMLQFMVQKLDQAPQPFFSFFFSLTSHNPYPLPAKYKGKFPSGPLEIHESIGYADFALEQFFLEAQKKPWYQNTIFVITGDHTQKTVNPRYQSVGGMYRVPLLIFVPGSQLPQPSHRVTQHIDVLPTLVSLLGIPLATRLKFGQSVFAPGDGIAFNGDERSHWILSPTEYAEFTSSDRQFVWASFDSSTWKHGPVLKEAADGAARELVQQLKAVLDYHNEGVLQNKLYAP